MKRLISAIGMTLVLVLLLTACASNGKQAAVSKGLGIDVSNGKVVSSSDSHDGFLGDGLTCTILSFPDEKTVEEIKENSSWTETPFSDTVKAWHMACLTVEIV